MTVPGDSYFDDQLTHLRKQILDESRNRDDIKIPMVFWDYVYQLEKCVYFHYKPPSPWKTSSHGGLDEWRKEWTNKDLPWHGAKL